jgi:hypothetical protein
MHRQGTARATIESQETELLADQPQYSVRTDDIQDGCAASDAEQQPLSAITATHVRNVCAVNSDCALIWRSVEFILHDCHPSTRNKPTTRNQIASTTFMLLPT